MPTFMKMIAAAAMVVAAQGAPVLDANEALDARMAKLEATVKELEFGAKVKALQDEYDDDGDDDSVKEQCAWWDTACKAARYARRAEMSRP